MKKTYIVSYSEFYDTINEAFLVSDFERANKLMLDYFKKNLGEIYPYADTEDFVVHGDSTLYRGQRWSMENGNQFRLNWLQKDRSYHLISIDVFLFNGIGEYPDINLDVSMIENDLGITNASIAKLFPLIVEFLKDPSENFDFGPFIESELTESRLFEYRTPGSKNKKVRSDKGKSRSNSYAKKGQPETRKDTNSIVADIDTNKILSNKNIPKYIKDEVVALINEMQSYIKMVANGIQNSLLLVGGSGLGKTYNVYNELKKLGLREGRDWYKVTGKSTPMALYMELYNRNGDLLVFDDCDSVLDDRTAVEILKGALDSNEEYRKISWLTSVKMKDDDGEPIPNSFEFNGKVIFVSNKEDSEVSDAIKSRAFVLNMSMDAEHVLALMDMLVDTIGQHTNWGKLANKHIRTEAFDELVNAANKNKHVKLTLRTLEKAIKIRLSGDPQWKRMIQTQCSYN